MTPAYEAIRNLLGLYCIHLDAGDFVALGELFAEGEMVDDQGRRIAAGAEGCTRFWRGLVMLYDGSPCTHHLVASSVIEVDGDAATSWSKYLALQQVPGGRIEAIAAGRYHDTFACRDGSWRFATRRFYLDQPGDLTRHIEGL